jgi:hypothetical protein
MFLGNSGNYFLMSRSKKICPSNTARITHYIGAILSSGKMNELRNRFVTLPSGMSRTNWHYQNCPSAIFPRFLISYTPLPLRKFLP